MSSYAVEDGRAEEEDYQQLSAFDDANGGGGGGYGAAGAYGDDERDTKGLLVPADEGGPDGVLTPRKAALAQTEVWRRVIFVVIPVFMGYASLVTLQHRLKNRYAANYGRPLTQDELDVFTHAATFNFVGNLVFRLAHNFVFAAFKPKGRVYFSLGSIILAMTLLLVFPFAAKSTWLGWVFIAYFVGGMGVGTFESNLLSVITPLGPQTKVWAICGMPVGFNIINIGGFLLLLAGLPLWGIYTMTLCAALGGCAVWSRVPKRPIERNATTWSEVRANLREWREWLPNIKAYCGCLMLDMYAVSFSGAIVLYYLNNTSWDCDKVQPSHHEGQVALYGIHDEAKGIVNHDAYFAVFNVFTFLGDTLSRKVAYWWKTPPHPAWFLLLSAAGIAMVTAKLPIIAPLGIFCVFFANGSVYALSTRHIDAKVPHAYNLISLSIWLFVGDIGSVSGANSWQPFKPLVCNSVPKTDRFFCVNPLSPSHNPCA